MYNYSTRLLICFISLVFSNVTLAAPPITGEPVIVKHLGVIDWPQDNRTITPNLTQLASNDINDFHGKVTCDLIISTPGNYHMALRDAMYGRPDLGHVGLVRQKNTDPGDRVTICWSTSPPVSIEQIDKKKLQFKNIKVIGKPALVMAPGGVMDALEMTDKIKPLSRQPFLTNRGNAILVRADKARKIQNVCDLGGKIRVVTPNPFNEPGSFGNFSGTIFNVADQNWFGCDATELFNSIFQQSLADFDLTALDNPYDINRVLSVFGRGSNPQGSGAKWVASSRIMHRDIPYALCNDEADAAVIFYHLARYMKRKLKASGCDLKIIPMGGTAQDPQPLPGNRVGTLHIAKVRGAFSENVKRARNDIYNFLTTSPVWETILNDHGLLR